MISGDISKLGQLAFSLPKFAAQAKQRILKSAAAEMLALVQEGFDTSTAPDGTKWAPLKYRVGQPLRKTGRLGNSFSARVTGETATVGTNTSYAKYHQASRPMLPEDGEPPPRWKKAIQEAVEEAVEIERKALP